MNIWIIDEKPKKRNNVWIVKGEIQINDFREMLYIPLDWWSLDDYKKQWEEGKKRLIYEDTSCFVVAIHDPNIRPYINWWLMYKVANKIYIRNQMIIGEIYEDKIGDKVFTLQTCYDFISERRPKYNEDGRKVSEWVTELPEVEH